MPGKATGSPSAARALFRREGEFWTIEYGDDRICLRDCLGLRYVAELLRHPGSEIFALDLSMGVRGQSQVTGSASDFPPGTARIQADISGEPFDPLDRRARSAYRECLRDLEANLDEAEDFNDAERATRVRERKQSLARELARRLRPGTPASSSIERARVRVTRSIKSTRSSRPSGRSMPSTRSWERTSPPRSAPEGGATTSRIPARRSPGSCDSPARSSTRDFLGPARTRAARSGRRQPYPAKPTT